MFKALHELVRQEINNCLTPNTPVPPVGYNPTAVIRGSLYPWVMVPVNGTGIWCKLRCMNGTQLNICGRVTLIELLKNNETIKSTDKLVEIRNIQERIAKETLLHPTLEEIENIILGEDDVIKKKRAELEEIKKIDISKLEPEQKAELLDRMDKTEIYIDFLLPDDTIAFLTAWALGVDVSDIKKLSKDSLLTAGLLARAGHDNATDHLSGVFTDRDTDDINATAMAVVAEYDHMQQVARNAKRGR